jgi:hypothetical protein
MQIKQIQTNLVNLILLQQIVLDHLKSIGNECLPRQCDKL